MGKTKTKKSKMTKVSRPRKNVRNGKGSKKNKTVKRSNFKKHKSLKIRGGAADEDVAASQFLPPFVNPGEVAERYTPSMKERYEKQQDRLIEKEANKKRKLNKNTKEEKSQFLPPFVNPGEVAERYTPSMKERYEKQQDRLIEKEANKKRKHDEVSSNIANNNLLTNYYGISNK